MRRLDTSDSPARLHGVADVYIYRCSADHEHRTARALHPSVGCQAMLPAPFNQWDYSTCGLRCWLVSAELEEIDDSLAD